jgi:coiled-coil and C2 domain-containing protein 1
MAKEAMKDLDSLKSAYTHNQPVPLYHYEKKTYQTLDCNSDLTDNDLELTIVRVINLPLPKDFDAKSLVTYVKYEFPYPPETAQTDKTNKQTGSLNPGNSTFLSQFKSFSFYLIKIFF